MLRQHADDIAALQRRDDEWRAAHLRESAAHRAEVAALVARIARLEREGVSI
jgi:hypothetical protein